jgi:chromosome segregation ATPase
MKISSLLREKGPALSLDNDLIQQAKLNHPGYDGQQALTLDMMAKTTQQQKTDAAQNNLINTQQNAIKSIGQELQDYEEQAQETDREVERLKQLSGTLTTGSADRQQKAKVSADELEKLQKDLKDLKSKPGMDPEKYKEIEQQISALANSSGAEDADVKKLQNLVNNIQNKANVNYDAVAAQLQQTKQDLDDKELRFKDYVKDTGDYKKTTSKELEDLTKTSELMAKNSAEEIKKYSDIVQGYQKQIDNFDSEIEGEKNAIIGMRKQIEQEVLKVNDLIARTKRKASIPWIAGKRPPSGSPTTPIEPQAELQLEEDTKILNKQGVITAQDNSDYNEWRDDHIYGLFTLFKNKYVSLVQQNGYSDKQIQDMLLKYLPKLYNLGDDSTPVSPKEVSDWMENDVKSNLEQEVVQYDVLRGKDLSETYARMLDNLIGLPYIKG